MLQIYYPFKPYVIAQHWGVKNDAYIPLGFSEHNGVDANVGRTGSVEYQTQFPVYCPVENFTVQQVDFAPKGGGNELWLISDEPVEMGDRNDLHAYIPLCHGKKILVKAGDKPKLGELLMIGDNTGFSTGPHCHMGLYRVAWDGRKVTRYNDINDANGSYNPELFFTGQYAIDKADLSTLINNGLTLAKYYSGML